MTNVETGIPPLKTPRAKKKTVKPKKKSIGRPFMYPDMTLVRMPKGTLKRVHAALKTDEGQADFMRTSIMTELKRRRK